MPLIAVPKSSLTPTDMQKRIQELEAQLAAKHTPQPLKLKVSAKGAVSVYNLNARFPVTLYGDQWRRLMEAKDQILAFIETNAAHLSIK